LLKNSTNWATREENAEKLKADKSKAEIGKAESRNRRTVKHQANQKTESRQMKSCNQETEDGGQ
jgi:hypothetical protein